MIFVVALLAVVAGVTLGSRQEAVNGPNAQPNPYRTSENWFLLPPGIDWVQGAPQQLAGQVVGVDFDAAGNIIVIRRADPPLLKFDPTGRRLLQRWGDGLFVQTHGLYVDREGFIWATDSDGREGRGYQVFKFSPQGQVVATLGKRGVSSEEPGAFVAPTDLTIAPNGDIFISDGHATGGLNHRIVKYSKDGRFIKAWGKTGSGPGQERHALCDRLAIRSAGERAVQTRYPHRQRQRRHRPVFHSGHGEPAEQFERRRRHRGRSKGRRLHGGHLWRSRRTCAHAEEIRAVKLVQPELVGAHFGDATC
jgi:hypothetical protein